MREFVLFSCDPPQRWRAGYVGSGETKKPFFFNCARCFAEGPEIAGFIARNVEKPKFTDVGIRTDNDRMRPALFCEKCYPLELAEARANGRPQKEL